MIEVATRIEMYEIKRKDSWDRALRTSSIVIDMHL